MEVLKNSLQMNEMLHLEIKYYNKTEYSDKKTIAYITALCTQYTT